MIEPVPLSPDSPPALCVDSPSPSIIFYNADHVEVGKLIVQPATLTFQGQADAAALAFFQVLNQKWSANFLTLDSLTQLAQLWRKPAQAFDHFQYPPLTEGADANQRLAHDALCQAIRDVLKSTQQVYLQNATTLESFIETQKQHSH